MPDHVAFAATDMPPAPAKFIARDHRTQPPAPTPDYKTSAVRWGRTAADFGIGVFAFETIKPGASSAAAASGRWHRTSISGSLRGIDVGLAMRMYFADEADANASDPVLRPIEPDARRATLIATRTLCDDKPVYRFDIHLQGEQDTVFLDI